MLENYLDVTNWSAATIAAINIEDERSFIFKSAISSYANIRMRMRGVIEKVNVNGNVILDWDRPFCKPSAHIDEWADSIIHQLRVECDDPKRAAVFFYHRIYSNIATKRALAVSNPELTNGDTPEDYDELIRLVINGIPEAFANKNA